MPSVLYDEAACTTAGLMGPCHNYRGRVNGRGYCQIGVGGRLLQAHRVAWEQEIGPIPDGMVIDHICRNRRCVNVAHLRVVTWRQNALENSFGASAINAKKTHCIHGHEYTAENTKTKKRGTNIERVCRICLRAKNRLKDKKRSPRRRKSRKET